MSYNATLNVEATRKFHYIKVGKKSLGFTLYLFLASVLISVSLTFLKIAIIMKTMRYLWKT